MTYALAWPLQQGLYELLTTNAACQAFFGNRVHDAAPPFGPDAAAEGLYLTIGDEEVRDWSTGCDQGAEHFIRLDVHAPRQSYAEAKEAAAAVSDAVLTGPIQLARGALVNARFVDARTARDEAGQLRRIEMRFRIILEDTL
ncbi:MAG: DUF3168 domain-containing protein [Pseudomonadota bacterium]